MLKGAIQYDEHSKGKPMSVKGGSIARMGLGLEEYSKRDILTEDKEPRQRIAEIARLMYERHLSDSGGGNLSCRVGERIYITPRYLGELHRFRVNIDEIIVMQPNAEVIEGDADMITREGSVHVNIYNTFAQVRAILHAHPRNILPFASMGLNIPANTEMFKHLLGNDDIEICDDVGPATDLLSKTLIDRLKRRENALSKYGSAVMIPNHGIIVAARNLNYAFCILETIETSAVVYSQTMLIKKCMKDCS